MAESGIQWSATSGHMKVGVNVRWDDIGAATTTSHVWLDFYIQSQAWGYDDNQRITFSGSLGGYWDYHFDSPSATTTTKFLGTYDAGAQATSYSGGPSWTFGGAISLAFDGSAPSISYPFTLPARPASPPSAPGTPTVDTITGTSARVASWTAPASNNGAAVDLYRAHIGSDPAFAPGTYQYADTASAPATIGSLTPGTTYYAMVIAHNAAGWSVWSGLRSFTTLNVPTAPAAPTISNILSDSVTATWTAPANGGSAITGYTVQIATNAIFTTGLQSFTQVGLSKVFTGLAPGVVHYVRVLATNAVGNSAYSTTTTTETITGAMVKVAGSWVPAKVWVKVGGVWLLAKVWKKTGGSWVL